MFIAIPSQIVLAIVMLSIIIVIGYLDIVYTLFGNITAIFGNNVGGCLSAMASDMVKRRSRRIDPNVYDEIHRRVREGSFTNAAELHRELQRQFPDSAPSERTVRNIVRELTPSNASGQWLPGPDTDPEEAVLVLKALAECQSRWKDSRPLRISNDRAKWLAWLLRGWPDLDPAVALVLATDYLVRREAGDSTDDLDGFLAFAPWRSTENSARWQEALKNGLPSPPLWYRTSGMVQIIQSHLEKESGGAKANGQKGQE